MTAGRSWRTPAWASPGWRWGDAGARRTCAPPADAGTAAPPAAKAKAVIWIFLCGGVSHVESFDPKPELEPIRRQVDRGDALQGRAQPVEAEGPRLGQSDARGPQDPDGAQHRLPQVRRVRAGGRRLVAARRLVRRRHRGGALALDHRQRPRGAAPVPHRPARPRGRPSDDRLVGRLRPGDAERGPAGVRRAGRADRRLLRRLVDPRRGLPGAGVRRGPAQPRRQGAAAVRRARPGHDRRGPGRRVQPAGPAQSPGGHRLSRRPGAAGADQGL